MIVDCVIYIQVAVQSILYLQKKKKKNGESLLEHT